jgi:hypothetical protein
VKKIEWMFNENERYQKLNQLSIQNGNQTKMIVQDESKNGLVNRSVPAL